jgi:chromosome partitioning protein
VARLKSHHDLVIIDSPPHAETEAKVAVRAANLVLVPVQPSPMDVWAMAPTLELARHEKVPILVVLNRVPPRGKVVQLMGSQLAEQRLPVATVTIGNRLPFAHAMLEGRTVLEQDAKGTAAAEIRALADEISARL